MSHMSYHTVEQQEKELYLTLVNGLENLNSSITFNKNLNKHSI